MSYTIDIFLPVIDETFSIEKTISEIEKKSSKYTKKYLITISKSKTTFKSLKKIKTLKKKYKKKIKVIYQEKPFLGGALLTAIKHIKSSHFVLMASDLETNPRFLHKLRIKSQKYQNKIIVASRWKDENSFQGYNFIKLILNKIFQIFFSFLYKTKLTDLTFGYRIYPSNIIKKIKLRELKHPILLETLIIPLKLGINVIEIKSNWKNRLEGKSHNPFLNNFLYVKTGIKVFFSNKKNLIL
ncbi:MAG: hypothetical protein CMM99_01565 [Rickettsiales bacterium]|nr:hypothetical protein [Rickettsiales bacterium]|tara:strand:- start:1503 stop:2225 length:723 start_codon:yes stop_codon:yes gene_type:complete